MRVWGEIQADQAQGQEGQSMTTATTDVKTLSLTDLYVAAFVMAKGHRLLGVDDSRPWSIEFHFSRMAKPDADAFVAGGMVEGRLFAAALKDLKGLLAKRRRGEDAG